ncbi:DDE-type integrase/transposase/recombinase [Mesomycoplasma ovipneumoniae]|uniref:DDE-type integrase/transposase/recombinase n=1 Tax=Mesomycoplasma ovipneumoniae TaxID=29562 RepID=UPI0028ACB168|nr:DDE-type integrase/transposase/recombinase [Mesomycoplasma ovipneumoniae]WNM16884.1 DDE-type integrase/transposase/recombinase [Mesomycoplasma ovipneumoniae]
MKQYKFTIEDKFKYIKIAESKGLKNAILHFAEEFREIYKSKSKSKKADKEWMLHIYANNLIRNWQKKFYNNDMKSLISVRGKIKSPRKPKRSIQLTIFLKNDREVYQEIMENVLRRYGIDPQLFSTSLKRKQEQEKDKGKIENCTRICSVFNINRTSIYEKIRVKNHRRKWFMMKNYLSEFVKNFNLNRKVKGRDVLYNIYKNQGNYVSTYVFQKHYEFLGLKSLAYKKQGKPAPKEKKFTRIWTEDHIKGEFSSENFGEKWFADIKFIKINNEWFYLHSIIETKSNYLLNFSISKTRFSEETINLVKQTIKKYNIKPKFFHSDHGVEYANYKFANFLKQNNIQQSMSPKGNALANRPIEYFYAVFQRELINIDGQNFENVGIAHQKISSFIHWYNYEKALKVAYHIKLQVIIWGKLFVQIFKMNMLEKINKSGVIKIIGKKLIVWDFSTYLIFFHVFFLF